MKMFKKFQFTRWYLHAGAMIIALMLLLVVVSNSSAQGLVERYFDETGHTVRGRFLTFFDKYGGLAIFGYPITEEFPDPKSGLIVQYFQRARLELNPNNPERFQVQLGLLGDELKYGQPRLPLSQIPSPTNPGCYYFPQTGHSVCNAFLDYFRAHGGLDVFGYPIAEYKVESDRIVQAFQRARMEWRPELATGQKVQLTTLGLFAFDFHKLDSKLKEPAVIRSVTRLNVRASVGDPVSQRSGIQPIYVFITDQHGKAVESVLVTAIVRFASGNQNFTFPFSNTRGMTQIDVPFGQSKAGNQVSIDITATYRNLIGQTRTSFLPWW